MGQRLALSAALLVCLAPSIAWASEPGSPQRVLILDSADPSEPVSASFEDAVREVLTSASSKPIDFYSEFLDSHRFQGSAYEAEYVAFLKQKYRERPSDVVVTIYPEALQFFLNHRADLWPGTPAVFSAVPEDMPRASLLGPRLTGVLTKVDIAGTLQLALALQPDARRVVVVSGASDFDRLWRARAEAVLRGFADRLEASFLDGLPLPALLRAVSDLPSGTIVLQTTVFRDGAGRALPPREVTQLVAEAAKVPVYGTFEPSMGAGVVGVSMVRLETQARRAGELALAILNGRDPGSLPVEPSSPAVSSVDWRQLRRFGLSESRLPAHASVLFRPPTMWDQYRGRILGGLAVLVFQFALIVVLLIERRHRRRAELRAQHQSVELAHASRLATVGEITASIAHQVNQPLGAILSNAEAAEMLLDVNPAPIDELRQILADIKSDDERASEVISGMRALLSRRDIQAEPIDLNRAIAQILRLLDGESRRHDVAVHADLAEGLPVVACERVHLQQIVLNLVMNGIEAAAGNNATGGRRVDVRTCRRGDGEVELTVTDTGRGIPPDQQPRLFESFFTTKKDGMGLGLSIARSLVEAHRGRIWAAASPAGGTVFHVVLPVNDAVRVSA